MTLNSKILIIKQNQDLKNTDEFITTNLFKIITCIDQKFLTQSLKYNNLLITSQSGVHSLIENLKHFGDNQIKSKKIFTVGSKTFNALVNNGFTNVVDSADNISSLTSLDAFNQDKILYLSGYDTAFKHYKDFRVNRLIIYKAMSTPLNTIIFNKIKNCEISHIFLYSKRSAEVFLENFPKNFNFQMINFICISENVAQSIKKINSKLITLYPNIPTEKEMFTIIQREHLLL
jgi:uroporphyrinogen-III synthase